MANKRVALIALWMTAATLVALAISLATWRAKYAPVPPGSEGTEAIGKSFELQQDMLMHGVAMHGNAPPVDHYSITPYPGFDGPEVLSRTILRKGTRFSIASIEKCSNCRWLFEERGQARVVLADRQMEAYVVLDPGWLSAPEFVRRSQ